MPQEQLYMAVDRTKLCQNHIKKILQGLQSTFETIIEQVEEVKDGQEENVAVERWFSEAIGLIVEPYLEQGRSQDAIDLLLSKA